MAGNAPDPATIGNPGVDGGFTNSYLFAYTYLVGSVTKRTNIYNYQVAKGGQTAGFAARWNLHQSAFKANEWEGYIQDSWRVLPSVIVTYGVRYTLLQAPYEVNGQQIATTVDAHDWFVKRGEAAAARADLRAGSYIRAEWPGERQTWLLACAESKLCAKAGDCFCC